MRVDHERKSDRVRVAMKKIAMGLKLTMRKRAMR